MSAMTFLTSGGAASTGGDLPNNERATADNIVRSFADGLRSYAFGLQVPASLLKVRQCNYLLAAKDTSHFHFVFAEAGDTSISYRDFSPDGRIELQTLVHAVRLEVGEVEWAFSTPLNASAQEREQHIHNIVQEYVSAILQNRFKPSGRISNEAISAPEIASGIEKFRVDHQVGSKTAFVIMQFGTTKPHNILINCIKKTLKKHGITAMRADDKQYMDDLFSNIKTYMHACDFGIAVFDRIMQDDFNPNVSLEVGYMLGMNKDVLLLKDQTLKSLQTDLTGRLYKQFDVNDVDNTVPVQIEKWLSDKGLG
jgi:hypothetical protein